MIQINLYTSYNTSEIDYFVNGDDPLCNNLDDTSIIFETELYE